MNPGFSFYFSHDSDGHVNASELMITRSVKTSAGNHPDQRPAAGRAGRMGSGEVSRRGQVKGQQVESDRRAFDL